MKLFTTTLSGFLTLGSLQLMATFAPASVIKEMKTVRFPIEKNMIKLNKAQENFADSVFNHLGPGEGAHFILITPEEELNLSNVEKANTSYKRAQAILFSCYARNYPKKEFYAQITPTNAPNKILTFDLTPSMYRTYSTGNAVTGIIFAPADRIATSQSSVEFDANIKNEVKTFSLDPKQDMVAQLPSGTKISFPQGSLVYANGKPVTEPVDLNVAEYTEMDAIVMKAMTTTCGGRELQTGGMWNINVSCNGVPVQMKNGMHYNIAVHNNHEVKNMQVFTGKIKNGKIDWELQNDGSVSAETVNVGGTGKNLSTIAQQAIAPNNLTNDINNFELNQNIWNNTRNNLNVNLNVNKINAEDAKNYYKKRKEMAVTEEEKVMIEEEEARFQNVYNLKLNDFGWINCDAFYEAPVKANILVTGEITGKTTAMLVYPKRKSVLSGYMCTDGKSVKFENVAADEAALLVVFAQVEGKDEIVKYTKMIVPGKEKNVVVKTSTSTYASLKAEINAKTADI